MTTFPMIRVKRSNEHVMAYVFAILLLYHLPLWIKDPMGILRLLLLIAVGIMIDVIFSLIRYKRVWCCVSGAITAAMISLLTNGAPQWGQLLGVAIGLIIGKHIWGGTGKNLLNPAMLGLLCVMLLFNVSFPFFSPTLWLLPAILCGLFLLKIRPFAGIGYIVGMIIAMIIFRSFSPMSIISYGVFFWSCLVITDPVTVTNHKTMGVLCGLLAGFATFIFRTTPELIPLSILMVNLCTAVINEKVGRKPVLAKTGLRIAKAVASKSYHKKLVDLTQQEEKKDTEQNYIQLSTDEILSRIQRNEVFGMGGAAFLTHRKLMAVMQAKQQEKQLIINGVECDPGLIHDAWLLRNYPKEIQKGIDILCKGIGFNTVHLAVKDLEDIKYSEHVKLIQVADSYPIGFEKLLIKEVLGKELTKGQIPAELGILVINVQTVYAIWQAVCLNKRIDTRFLTVADLKSKTAQVVLVKLGSSMKEVMEAVYPGVVNVFAGGGIMQAYLAEEDARIDKNTNLIATGNYPHFKESPQCSRCGSCSEHCPSGLKVNLIADMVDQGKQKDTWKYHADECIGCGSCSYSCPGGRNLAARVKLAKEAVRS